jgi:hypothetical protein
LLAIDLMIELAFAQGDGATGVPGGPMRWSIRPISAARVCSAQLATPQRITASGA